MRTYTIKQAATHIGCSVRTINRAIAAGQLDTRWDLTGRIPKRIIPQTNLDYWANHRAKAGRPKKA